MKEQIIINGQELDTKKGSFLQIYIESNLLKKADNLSCCYTYTHTLPNTTHNKTIFGDLLRIGRSGANLRDYLPAEYYRDGLLIFSGRCYVVEATQEEIKISFKFGINEALQDIKNDGWNINKLFNQYERGDGKTGFWHEYTDEEIAAYKLSLPCSGVTDCEKYPFSYSKPYALFLQDYQVGGDSFDANVVTPAVNIEAVFDRIKYYYGLELDANDTPRKNWILTPSKARYDRFSTIATGTTCEFITFESDWGTTGGTYITPLDKNDINGRQSFTITSAKTPSLKIYYAPNILHSYKINAIFYNATGFPTETGSVKYTLDYSDGESGFRAKTMFSWTSKDDVCNGYFFPKSEGLEYKFKAQSGPTLIIRQSEKSARGDEDTDHPLPITDLKIVFYCQLDDDESEKGYFNAIDCLPEMSITDFIYNYTFGVLGKYIINTMNGGNKLKCVSLEEIKESAGYDWSKKLLNSEIELEPKIDGIARNNYIKYGEDYWKEDAEVNLPCDNESLDKEADIASLKFTYHTEQNFMLKIRGEKVTPRAPQICSVSATTATPYGGVNYAALNNNFLKWYDDKGVDYELLTAIYKEPLKLKCKLHLTPLDLSTLDLSKKVFFEQFGAYFIIQKLSVGETTTTAELIKLY